MYHKVPKYQTPEQIAVIILKFEQMWLYHQVMSQKHVDRMANCVEQSDPVCSALPVRKLWIITV